MRSGDDGRRGRGWRHGLRDDIHDAADVRWDDDAPDDDGAAANDAAAAADEACAHSQPHTADGGSSGLVRTLEE